MTVRIERAGRGWVLEAQTVLPRTIEEVFPFFADAQNLEALTPPTVGFEIISPLPIEMRVGTLIDYRIRLHGFPLRWRTRIRAWEPPVRFVDEQLRGLYRRWVHDHRFESRGSWTICRDRVEYALLGGGLVHRRFVAPRLREIFQFRGARLAALMGRGPESVEGPLESGNMW